MTTCARLHTRPIFAALAIGNRPLLAEQTPLSDSRQMQGDLSSIDLSSLRRVGQGRTAEVFALDDDRVIKVARASTDASLDREAAALLAARAGNVPVPAALGLVAIAGRRALIMGRVRGASLIPGSRRLTRPEGGAATGRLG